MRNHGAGLAAVALTVGVLGCSSESGSPSSSSTGAPPDGGTVSPCDPGQVAIDGGACEPAGLPSDMPCPPGEWEQSPGTCVPAGVAPDGCGDGFTHDGNAGCEPILPASDCSKGEMAVPGDTTCHEIAPCGSGTWGDIPVQANTEYVDQSYAGADSDGTAAKPWLTISDAVEAAAPGAIVAIAEGSYAEDVVLNFRPRKLWGRCPSLVEIVGSGAELAAVTVLEVNTNGTEIRGVALTGASGGIAASGAEGMVVDGVWVHDADDRGITLEDVLGPTSATVTRTLIEDVPHCGVFGGGAEITLEGVVVRRTTMNGQSGRGVQILNDDETGRIGKLTLRTSLVEESRNAGVYVGGSDALIENTVVRRTLVGTNDRGHGIEIVDDPTTGTLSTATVRTSLLDDNAKIGIAISGSDVTLESTVVRGTQPSPPGESGYGMQAGPDPQGGTSHVDIKTSLFDDNYQVGIFIAGVDGVIESTRTRRTVPSARGAFGLEVGKFSGLENRAHVELYTSALEEEDVGALILGSDAVIESTLVTGPSPGATRTGRGIAVQIQCDYATQTCDPSRRSTASIHASRIEQSADTGIFVGTSDLTLTRSVVSGTLPTDGKFGDGVDVLGYQGPASATVTGVRIENSARAGIAAFGAAVTVGTTVLECSAFDLDSEVEEGVEASYEDEGENVCGCQGAMAPCKLTSSMLAPPAPAGL